MRNNNSYQGYVSPLWNPFGAFLQLIKEQCIARRDQVSENMDENVKDLWEVIGVETDEAADVDLAAYQHLLPKKARNR